MSEAQNEGMHAGGLEFAAIVAPLERRAGRPLNGPGRLKCAAAFDEAPDGFPALASDALRRARLNPLGLLCRMVEAGEHRLAGGGGRLETALAWARKTAPLLPPEGVDEILAGFDLSAEQETELRQVISNRRAQLAA